MNPSALYTEPYSYSADPAPDGTWFAGVNYFGVNAQDDLVTTIKQTLRNRNCAQPQAYTLTMSVGLDYKNDADAGTADTPIALEIKLDGLSICK